jgi:ParB-like nuclease domain
MVKPESFPIFKLYVPAKRRGTANPDVIRDIAESMLDIGQQTPIRVRRDGDRFILVEGLHRLEACKALGEETILGFIVEGPVEPQRTTPPQDSEAVALRQKMARLRELRLANEAAKQAFVPEATSREPAAKKSKGQTVRAKKISLAEWLREREFDGGRR